MPFVTVTASPGLNTEQKRQLLQRSSETVVQSLDAPLPTVRVILHEIPEEHYLSGGQHGSRTVMYEVAMIAGRSEEKKATLIASLSKVAHEVTGVPFEEVRTRIIDFPNTDMGMPGGITAKQAGR